jgi:microcystin-dependent protein
LPAVDGSALTNINGSSIDGSTLTNVNAVRLQSRAISSATPNDNEVLTWNNTTLTWEPRTISTGGITALTGEVIASGSGSVAATIAENAITSAKINNTGNTQNRLLITDSTSGATVTYATCALNQILKWNSTGWECATDSNTGVSSVSSANTDISVANGSTTPVLTLNSGTTGGATDANKIAKLSASGLLAAAMIPDFAASKITSGVLPIARGGTNSGTTLNNNRVMISSGGAIVENAAITASRALASDANGLPVASSVTSTELGYVSGVTSSIQTQLNSKQASLGYTPVNKAGDTMTGALTLPSNGLNVGTTQLVVSGGSVGVGTSSPKAQLDVNGGVRLGNDTATCDSTKKGTIRFTGTSFQACDGSSWFTLATPGGLTPAGAVTAMSTATCPSGYLSANGTAVSRTTYPDLFTAIGVMYGSGDGSTTFNLPDYRGEFLRGWDNGAGRDPDAASRTNRGDSTTGDNVGTKQGDNMIAHTHSGSTLSGVTSVDGAHTHAATGLTATASSAGAHTHTFSATGSFNDNTVTGTNGSWDKENNNGSLIQKLTVSTVANSVSVSGTTSSDGAHTHTITMGGSVASAGAHSHTVTISGSTGSAGAGTETRPRNVNVLYCIKY